MYTLWQNLRYGFRMLAKNPGFTAVAVLTLALGVGANTAIFSVVHAVLLRPLPFPEPDRLVMLWEDLWKLGFSQNPASPANYLDWKMQNRVFQDMAAIRNQTLNLTSAGEPVQLDANFVSASLFSVLGVKPILGRVFLEEEDRPGAAKVVLLSYRVWQQNFGADPNLPGKTVLLDNEPYTVLGVMPRGFHFPEEGDVWIPVALSSRARSVRSDHYLRVVGRLKPGVTLEQARAEMGRIARRLELDYPESNKDAGVTLVPLRDQFVGNLRRILIVLLVAVGCVLLIACSNVANLLLARAAGRQREMAVRAALGATRRRLIRQVVTESILLSLLGGACGLLLASWTLTFLSAMIPRSLPGSGALEISTVALVFTAALSALTGLVFGLAPAARMAGADLSLALSQGGRGGVGAGSRMRHVLVVAEVALALPLLITGGLMLQTLYRLGHVDPGFQADHVLALRTPLPRGRGSKYNDLAARTAFYRDVLAHVKALPGVVAAGYITYLPLTNPSGGMPFLIEGRPAPLPGQPNVATLRAISPDYPRAMGIPLRAGRLINESDGPESLPVVLINETMARRYWPGENPIGRRFKLDLASEPPWVTIIGILGDVRHWELDLPAGPQMYFSYQQPAGSFGYFAPRDLVIRTARDPMSLAAAVRHEIRAVDPNQPVSDVRTLEDVLEGKLAQRRLQTRLLGAFAALALVLAAVGLYGVLAYTVAQRTREIGVRMALGAGQRAVFRSVIGQGMRLVSAGLVIGMGAAWAASRLSQGLLFGVTPTDPLTFLATTLLLAVVGLVACYVPARRATKVDPIAALRHE